MNQSPAFNIFLQQSLRKDGIPFEIHLNQLNKETIVLCQRRKKLQRLYM
ncbi:hypothetical protein [Flintibacter sp. KGMB00164]|nr:hypothetical protein [Flintibacter sp. KGMB00164]